MNRPALRSIEVELPLSIFGFLVLVIGVLSTAAYFEVRSSRLENASQRLETVTAQLATLSETSVRQRIAQVETLAADPRIQAYLDHTGSSETVRGLLDSLASENPNAAAVELYDAFGDAMVSSDSTPTISSKRVARYHGDAAFIGPITNSKDGLVSEAVAPVTDGQGGVRGYLVYRRRTQSPETVREMLSQLIGGDALFLVGNDSGGVWTDLVAAVEAPPRHMRNETGAQAYVRDSNIQRLGVAAPVAGTPWQIVVEYPLATVLAPVHRFFGRLLLTSLALVLVGGVGAWLVSRTITRRLRRATAAAASVAAGQYDQRIADDRPDELGGLARAFNTMADAVEDGRHRLEAQVDERTSELHEALHDLRDAQETLVRKERLALLGQLSSGLGHELRNPLGVMSNAVYFLESITKSDDPRVARYLTIVRDQIGLSKTIVGDLLDFARPHTANPSDFPLASLVGEQVNRVGEHGLEVGVAVPEDLMVHGDPVQLGQVVFNLLTNARQATEDVAAPVVTVTAERDTDGQVLLHIADNGCGIPPERLDQIFDPLYTTRARGIGLGLALTRSYVNANGGIISVQSTVDEGTTFSVRMPAAAALVTA